MLFAVIGMLTWLLNVQVCFQPYNCLLLVFSSADLTCVPRCQIIKIRENFTDLPALQEKSTKDERTGKISLNSSD